MGKRDDLIEKYAEDLREKCGMQPDMDLLTKVTIGCGPAIYNADSATVAATQEGELETVKAMLEKVNDEDRGCTERVYRGLLGRLAAAGREPFLRQQCGGVRAGRHAGPAPRRGRSGGYS